MVSWYVLMRRIDATRARRSAWLKGFWMKSLAPASSAQPLAQRIAVHFWHDNVREHQVREHVCHLEQRFRGRACRRDRVAARSEHRLQGHSAQHPCPRSHWTHSVTSGSTDGGIVIPSARSVLVLTSSSKTVGCSTGRSAGLASLGILST